MILCFLYIFNLLIFASNYTDFVDSLYYEKIGNYKKSYDILEKISESDTDSYLNYLKYDIAVKGFRANQIPIEKLEENVEKILETEPDNPDNLLLYAATKFQKGEIEQAIKAYKKVLEIDPRNIEAYYQLALITSSDTSKSLYYFNKILEIDPSLSADVYYNIAVLYSLKKDTKKVVEYIDKSIKENPSSIKPYYFMALYWEENNNINKAIEFYEKIIDMEPNNISAMEKIAELYISTSNYSMAGKWLERLIQFNPENKRALWWLSLIEENSKNYTKAKEYLSKIEGWDQDIDMVLKMSYYSIVLGSVKDAVKILEDAYKKWPENIVISYYLGLGMMDMKRFEEAKKYFEVFASSNPSNYEVNYNLGVICEKIGDLDCLKRYFGKILVYSPDDSLVLNYLGYSLIDRDIVDEEIFVDSISIGTPFEMVKKALSKDPENYAYLDSLAWAYFKKKEYTKALEYIERAIDFMNKKNTDIDSLVLEHRADILSALEKYDLAYSDYMASYLISDSSRIAIIQSSVLKILPYVSYSAISDTFKKYFPYSFYSFPEIKVMAEYRKFIFKRRIRYTFSSLLKYDLNGSEFYLNVYESLFGSISEISYQDNKLDIKTAYKGDNDSLKTAALGLFSFLRIPIIFGEKKFNRDKEGFIFKDVYEKNDKLVLNYVNNFIIPDYIEYSRNKSKVKIKIDSLYNSESKKFVPHKIYLTDENKNEVLISFENGLWSLSQPLQR